MYHYDLSEIYAAASAWSLTLADCIVYVTVAMNLFRWKS